MSQNVIQFQHGLSWEEFLGRYGTEAQCEAALVAARWPHGWRCAHCGCQKFFHTRNGHGRLLWECFICGYQTSSIAGTVLEHTKIALRKWFQAMYLLTQIKTSLAGTLHSFKHAKYGARYLAEFAYRFNWRFDMLAMIPRLLRAAVLTKPQPLRKLRLSEVCA